MAAAAEDFSAFNSRKRQLAEGESAEVEDVLTKKPSKDFDERVRLHISNVPYEMKWQELKDLFREKVGEEVNFVEIYNGTDGRPSGVGVIEVKNHVLAQKAMHAMHRTEVRGRMIIVREETEDDIYKHQVMSGAIPGSSLVGPKSQGNAIVPPGDVLAGLDFMSNSFTWQTLDDLGIDSPNISSQVFVANLDYKVTAEQISELFRIAGNVINVEIKLDKENKFRGMALVRYDHPMEALQAISLLNGQSYFDRTLIVRVDKVASSKSQLIPHKLPLGLQSIGIGFGTNGQPLYDVGQLSNGLIIANLFGMLTRKKAMAPPHALPIIPAIQPSNQIGGVPASHGLITGHLSQHNMSSTVGAGVVSASGINLETIIEETVKAVTNKLGGLVSRDTPKIGMNPDIGVGLCGDMSHVLQRTGFGDAMSRPPQAPFNYSSPMGFGVSDHLAPSLGLDSPMMTAQKCSVSVANLPLNYKWQSLKDKFKEIGEVVYADVKQEYGRTCSVGSVRFKTSLDARRAADKLNGVIVDGRRIEVRLM